VWSRLTGITHTWPIKVKWYAATKQDGTEYGLGSKSLMLSMVRACRTYRWCAGWNNVL